MIEGAAPKLTDLMKLVTAGVINSMQLPEVYIGKVVSENPLSIRLSADNILPANYLILTNAVKDHMVEVTIEWETEENKHKHGNGNDGQDTTEVTHKHDILGRKKMIVHNGLTTDEMVLLLRVQGGQNYVVVDRINDKLQTSGDSV